MDWSKLLPPYVPVRLPSQGKLYTQEELKEGFVEIREYAAPEESLLASANRDNMQRVISSVLDSCIKGDWDIGVLTAEDSYYLLVWLRANSYSPDYDMEVSCPKCSPESTVPYVISLASLEVKYLADDAIEPLVVTLPKTNLKVSLKAIRRSDEVKAQERIAEVRQYKGVKGDPADLLRRAYSIVSIEQPNGTEVTDRLSIENLCLFYLPSKDSLFIDERLKYFAHGLDPNVEIVCKMCNKKFSTTLPPSIEFFRPSRFIERSEDSDASGDSGLVNARQVGESISQDSVSERSESISPDGKEEDRSKGDTNI